MNSPRVSFEEEEAVEVDMSIKERLASVINFCMQVLLFLGAFIVVASLVLYIIYNLNSLPVRVRCPVNRTYPLDHEIFLRDAARQREEQLP